MSIPCTTTNFQCPLLNRLSTTLALLQTIETMSHFTAEPEKCSWPVAYNKLVNSAHDPGRNKVVMFLCTLQTCYWLIFIWKIWGCQQSLLYLSLSTASPPHCTPHEDHGSLTQEDEILTYRSLWNTPQCPRMCMPRSFSFLFQSVERLKAIGIQFKHSAISQLDPQNNSDYKWKIPPSIIPPFASTESLNRSKERQLHLATLIHIVE